MGNSSSRQPVYPLGLPPIGYEPPRSGFSLFGKNKKKDQQYYYPGIGGYTYAAQPFLYQYPQQQQIQPQPQHYTSAYYPQGGGVPVASTQMMSQPQQPVMQPQMQMPQPGYDPAPPPVQMPNTAPVIPPPPQGQVLYQQQPQQPGHMPVIPPPPDQMPPPQPQVQPVQVPLVPPISSYSIYGPPVVQSNNPLPSPPKDLYEMSPYKSLMRDLPTTAALLSGGLARGDVRSGSGRGGGVGFPSLLGRKKDKKRASANDVPPSLSGLFGSGGANLSRSNTAGATVTYLSAPPTHIQPQPQPQISIPQSPSQPEPQRQRERDPQGPPVRFDHTSPLSGFMNHSPHRVLYQNKLYPSALHLLEALKFIVHRPDLSERIRACKDVHDVYPLSASMQEFVRPDWGEVFLKNVEEVLYLKFKQHPDLRSLLMGTGDKRIVYSEEGDSYWGEGEDGEGENQLGEAIVRVRERLRREGHAAGSGVNGGATVP